MPRAYIPIGIDHGTTNSAIARMNGNAPEILKPDSIASVMPSAVYYDKTGRLLLGRLAIEAIMSNGPTDGEGHRHYKPVIGEDNRYAFSAARKSLSAPELGGLVIGELLKVHRTVTGEETLAAVITVPAEFPQNACKGTEEAAALAGLKYHPLLMEPVAASIAHGFSSDRKDAKWMIFDLGGGTLDISLVTVQGGNMTVPSGGHAGDPHLGGSHFDRALMDYAIDQLRKTYDLEGFSPENEKYRIAWGVLLYAVEQAKIRLSTREETRIERDVPLCVDNKGKEVVVDIPITRRDYEPMIAGDVQRAIYLAHSLLRNNRLAPKDIDKVILVGGPTQTPCIREALANQLKIPLDQKDDPMTVVACGAALYGMTQEIPVGVMGGRTKRSGGENYTLRIECEKYSRQPSYHLVGKVESSNPSSLSDLSVEMTRLDDLWSSGSLPINARGMFSVEVLLIDKGRPTPSRFKTVLRNRTGEVLASVEEPEIWYPFMDSEDLMTLANSLRVGLANNETDVLVKQGSKLPASGSGVYKMTGQVRKGSREDILVIPVLESVPPFLGPEDDHEDCNSRVGALKILGDDEKITRDLPAQTRVEVTIEEDEHREIKLSAFIPLIDEEFEVVFEKTGSVTDVEEVRKRFDTLKLKLKLIQTIQREFPKQEVEEGLKTLESLTVVEGIERDLKRAAHGEPAPLRRANLDSLRLASSLNHLAGMQTEGRIRNSINSLSKRATGRDADSLRTLRSDLDKAAAGNHEDILQTIEKRLVEMDIRLRMAPIYLLYHSLFVFPQQVRGTPEQVESFREGQDLILEIAAKLERGESILDEMIVRVERAHDRLRQAWGSQLQEWIRVKPGPAVDETTGVINLKK